jgi:8-oxo-dGTP pyrophosphatase MutT (NUDIX family)
MKKEVFARLGIIGFFASLPALKLYLRGSSRTRVLVVYDGRMLLLKLWLSDGTWMLPGGGSHRKEQASDAAIRELREETGIRVAPEQLTLLGQARHVRHGFDYRYTVFTCELTEEPVIRQGWPEIIGHRWVDIDGTGALGLSEETVFALERYRGRLA